MSKVADGDFSVRIHSSSSSREIQEIYAGFNLMAEELQSTEILQTDFVSNVSHEFKTPINAIEGYSMLLQGNDDLTEEQREYVEKILFNTKRLSSLTGSILLLSKIENQKIATNNTSIRLDEQILETVVTLEPLWEAKNVDFDIDMGNISYFGNEMLMYHVWSNLIANAIKFGPVGGTVKLRLYVNRDGNTVFTVTDRGEGLSEDAKKHIFDKFYQGDSSHKEEGNGLGLSLVKKILDLEGGSIYAENVPEGGCRFTVTLRGNDRKQFKKGKKK
jgi:signal transduction histidine kinase